MRSVMGKEGDTTSPNRSGGKRKIGNEKTGKNSSFLHTTTTKKKKPKKWDWVDEEKTKKGKKTDARVVTPC